MRRTVLSFVLLLTASMLTLSSCSVVTGEFTVLGTRNFEPGQKYVSKGEFTGESSMNFLIFFPLKSRVPHWEYAIENALDLGEGDILTDVEISEGGFSIFLYTNVSVKAKGEVWARTNRLSAADLEGKEVFELMYGDDGYQLVSTENPAKRISVSSKDEIVQEHAQSLETETQSVH